MTHPNPPPVAAAGLGGVAWSCVTGFDVHADGYIDITGLPTQTVPRCRPWRAGLSLGALRDRGQMPPPASGSAVGGFSPDHPRAE